MGDVILRTQGLSKSFGGLAAVRDVSLSVERGRVQAVIGPNGAGKTTLLNLITGNYLPTAGQIWLAGREITALPPHAIAGMGVARTFQSPQVFHHMTALENVLVGAHVHADRRLLSAVFKPPGFRRREAALRDEAMELMRFVRIEDRASAEASALPYGVLKRLELARALALKPKLLLLDEPAAGLNASETEQIGTLIRRLPERGITPVLVEHDMKLVMGVSDTIHVLDQGRTLVEGPPDEVQRNPQVIEAYLGTEDDAGPARTECVSSSVA